MGVAVLVDTNLGVVSDGRGVEAAEGVAANVLGLITKVEMTVAVSSGVGDEVTTLDGPASSTGVDWQDASHRVIATISTHIRCIT